MQGLMRQLIDEFANQNKQVNAQTQALINVQSNMQTSFASQGERYLQMTQKMQEVIEALVKRTEEGFTKSLDNHRTTQTIILDVKTAIEAGFEGLGKNLEGQGKKLDDIRMNIQHLQSMLKVMDEGLGVIANQVGTLKGRNEDIEDGKSKPSEPIPQEIQPTGNL